MNEKRRTQQVGFSFKSKLDSSTHFSLPNGESIGAKYLQPETAPNINYPLNGLCILSFHMEIGGWKRKRGWEGLAGDSPHSRTMTRPDWWLEEKGREGRTGRGLTTQPDHDNTRLVAGGEREGGKDRQGTHHTAGP